MQVTINIKGTAKQGRGYIARITGLSEQYRFEREFEEPYMDFADGDADYDLEPGIYEIKDCGRFDSERGAPRNFYRITESGSKLTMSTEEVEAVFSETEEAEENEATEKTYSEIIEGLASDSGRVVETSGYDENILDHRNDMEGDGPMCVVDTDEIAGVYVITRMEDGYRDGVEATVYDEAAYKEIKV